MQLKKQLRAIPYKVSDVQFQITPFAAMDSIAVFGNLMKLLEPVLKLVVPALSQSVDTARSKNSDTVNLDDVASNITTDNIGDAISSLSGKQLVSLFNDLLIAYGNVVFLDEEEMDLALRYKKLDLNSFNEIFCQDIGAAISLCVKVVTINYSNFFGGLEVQFGGLTDIFQKKTSASMENSTPTLSAATSN